MTNSYQDGNEATQDARQRLIANLAVPRLRDAVALYFDPAQPFAGQTFDSLGDNPSGKIVSDDLLAVTLLDVRWTPLAVRRILSDQAAKIRKLLDMIDDKTEIWAPDGREQLDAAEPLWELLCSLPGWLIPGRASCWPASDRSLSRSRTVSSLRPAPPVSFGCRSRPYS